MDLTALWNLRPNQAELERLQRKNAELEMRVRAERRYGGPSQAELERLQRKTAELEMRVRAEPGLKAELERHQRKNALYKAELERLQRKNAELETRVQAERGLKAELERLQRKNAELETRVQADADVKAELERLRRKYAELEMRVQEPSADHRTARTYFETKKRGCLARYLGSLRPRCILRPAWRGRLPGGFCCRQPWRIPSRSPSTPSPRNPLLFFFVLEGRR